MTLAQAARATTPPPPVAVLKNPDGQLAGRLKKVFDQGRGHVKAANIAGTSAFIKKRFVLVPYLQNTRAKDILTARFQGSSLTAFARNGLIDKFALKTFSDNIARLLGSSDKHDLTDIQHYIQYVSVAGRAEGVKKVSFVARFSAMGPVAGKKADPAGVFSDQPAWLAALARQLPYNMSPQST
ncbi:hypothetical protein WJX77_009012 [Trebouxia sp. C0004]